MRRTPSIRTNNPMKNKNNYQCWNKGLTECITGMLRCVIHHNRMHNSSIIHRKRQVPSSIHMFIIIHKTIDSIARITRSRLLIFLMKSLPRNQLRRCNIPPNHRPVCSSISQQHCHRWAGHDSSKDKGQCRLTHSRGTQSANQHHWVYQAINISAKPA